MLVLSRKAGERINIGNNITVEVRRVAGNRVTIALHAPKEVRILRGELKEAAEEFTEQPAEVAQCDSTPAEEEAVVHDAGKPLVLFDIPATA